MNLSKNFKLSEFLLSQTAERNGIQMAPSIEVEANLKRLCDEVLQPARDLLGKPFFITSGYRPPLLNRLIGGSATSDHMYGRAADFVVQGYDPIEVAQFLEGINLPYKQLILEFGRWIHISIDEEGKEPRREELTAYRIGNSTQYQHGIVKV